MLRGFKRSERPHAVQHLFARAVDDAEGHGGAVVARVDVHAERALDQCVGFAPARCFGTPGVTNSRPRLPDAATQNGGGTEHSDHPGT